MNTKYKMKEAEMKTVSIKLEDELHKRLKIYAANEEKSITEIVAASIKKELKTKKEQSR